MAAVEETREVAGAFLERCNNSWLLAPGTGT